MYDLKDLKDTALICIGVIVVFLSIYAYSIPPQPGDYRLAAIIISGAFGVLIVADKVVDKLAFKN